jgi:hypothetical protein
MKLEVLEKEGYYHIYNRGINGCMIFGNDENKISFSNNFQNIYQTKFQYLPFV